MDTDWSDWDQVNPSQLSRNWRENCTNTDYISELWPAGARGLSASRRNYISLQWKAPTKFITILWDLPFKIWQLRKGRWSKLPKVTQSVKHWTQHSLFDSWCVFFLWRGLFLSHAWISVLLIFLYYSLRYFELLAYSGWCLIMVSIKLYIFWILYFHFLAHFQVFLLPLVPRKLKRAYFIEHSPQGESGFKNIQ